MPAIPKPHRIAVLVPEVKLDGPDAATSARPRR